MEGSPSRPPVSLRLSHLDSGTYRAVLRLLAHCVQAQARAPPASPRLSPSRAAHGGTAGPSGEREWSGAAEGAAVFDAAPGEGNRGMEEAREHNGQECHQENGVRDLPEDGAAQGFHSVAESGVRERSEDLVGSGPSLADAHDEIPPPVEGLGLRETRAGLLDNSRNVLSSECPVDSPHLLEELEQKKEDDPGGRDSARDVELLGSGEVSPPVDASELGEDRREARVVDESGCHKLRHDDRQTELAHEDPRLPSAQPRDSCSEKEQGMIEQIEIHDSSLPSTGGSGPTEFSEGKKTPSLSAIDENEMEEGEIPGEVGASESHLVADDGMLPDTMDTLMNQTASTSIYQTKETMCSAACEPNQPVVGVAGLSPEKKKKNSEASKEHAGKIKKKPGKPLNIMVDLELSKQMSGVITRDAGCEHTISSSFSSSEVCIRAIQREEDASEMKDVKVQEKTKRGPLTENRKEKKKLAKKRKRAEINKKLGVKRLKLEMPSKTRKVIPCSFYQKGRCQKGNLCKFSHDMIPDTKSMPCTFFARGTCLKGDDCPFDHELSKYPCHNYVSEGRCNRGDSCLFSHKVPTGELPAASSGKPSLQNHMNLSNSAPKDAIPGEKPSILRTPTELMRSKQPVSVPKGVCFLSFGGGNKQLHGLASERGGSSVRVQRREERAMSEEPRRLSPPGKSPLLVLTSAETRPLEDLPSEAAGDDASKILDEFLLSGIA